MKSSKTSFLRNCISGWNVRLQGGREEQLRDISFFHIFALEEMITIKGSSEV